MSPCGRCHRRLTAGPFRWSSSIRRPASNRASEPPRSSPAPKRSVSSARRPSTLFPPPPPTVPRESRPRAMVIAPEGLLMLEPEQTTFVLLSFEGPDEYSQAGGLGVRAKEWSRALAERGFETHLFFVGDPKLPADESSLDGRLWLHRWSLSIRRYYPACFADGAAD